MHLDFSLPLKDPVLVFSIILFIILFTPILLNRLKIPPIIGLILSGVLVGPNGLNLLTRNASVVLFGTVGLLYIMFLAGLEIDLNEFKKNKYKSLTFGAYTFFIPIILGTFVFFFILPYSLTSAILVASMFASHTLLTYPSLSKLGVTKNIAVNVAVGGTMITDTAALLVLAVIVSSTKGELDINFWTKLTFSIILFVATVLLGFPIIGRWFFKRYDDNISQYIFVLGMVFLAAFLAQLAGIEAIIGAFLAGLALNRLIPHTSPLMNRIEFVGNALFIPFFLMGVGMLIDYKVLFKGFDALVVAAVMSILATVAKFLAAWATQKTFKFSNVQRDIIFGLSNSQAAATLAAVLIGYEIIIGQNPDGTPMRLLDENILNGTIIMILITCTISSFVSQKAGIQLAQQEIDQNQEINTISENTLVGLANEATVDGLIQLAISTLDKKKQNKLYGLHIITANNENPESVSRGNKMMEKAEKFAAAADFQLNTLLRYDQDVASGIINTVKEKNVRHFYIGLHEKANILDSFFGKLTDELLEKCYANIYIQSAKQPLNTLKKYVLLIPENAEQESSFLEWYARVTQIAQNTGNEFKVFAHPKTIQFLVQNTKKNNLHYIEFETFEDFLVLAQEVSNNTMFIINLARKDSPSYQVFMKKIPTFLHKYFKKSNFMLVYPALERKIEYKEIEENNPKIVLGKIFKKRK